MNHLSVWDQLTKLPYLTLYTRLVNSAMELDVFSHLSEKTTAAALAQRLGWNPENTSYLLCALTSIGFIEKDGSFFKNTPQAEQYLVKGRPEYLGGFLLFYGRNEGTTPMDVPLLVREGPQPMAQMEQQLDFSQYSKTLREAQAGYRQQELLKIVRALPENNSIQKVLDAGCATGLLGLAVIGDAPSRTGVLFDQLPKPLIQESVDCAGLTDRVEVISGNFMSDDIGSGYDLILAVSIMLFAKGNMEALLKKFYDALNPGGVLLVISEGIAQDKTGPWDMVLGYLPYYLHGMDMGVLKDEVAEAAKRAGFTRFEKHTEILCSGTQDIDILRK